MKTTNHMRFVTLAVAIIALCFIGCPKVSFAQDQQEQTAPQVQVDPPQAQQEAPQVQTGQEAPAEQAQAQQEAPPNTEQIAAEQAAAQQAQAEADAAAQQEQLQAQQKAEADAAAEAASQQLAAEQAAAQADTGGTAKAPPAAPPLPSPSAPVSDADLTEEEKRKQNQAPLPARDEGDLANKALDAAGGVKEVNEAPTELETLLAKAKAIRDDAMAFAKHEIVTLRLNLQRFRNQDDSTARRVDEEIEHLASVIAGKPDRSEGTRITGQK